MKNPREINLTVIHILTIISLSWESRILVHASTRFRIFSWQSAFRSFPVLMVTLAEAGIFELAVDWLFTTPTLWQQELFYSKSHFSLHVKAKLFHVNNRRDALCFSQVGEWVTQRNYDNITLVVKCLLMKSESWSLSERRITVVLSNF